MGCQHLSPSVTAVRYERFAAFAVLQKS